MAYLLFTLAFTLIENPLAI